MTTILTSVLMLKRCCPARFIGRKAFRNGRTTEHPRSYVRPSIAPKPTLDIKHIRLNPGLYSQNCVERNYASLEGNSWQIAELFGRWQTCEHEARRLRTRNNDLQAMLKQVVSKGKSKAASTTEILSKEAIIKEAKSLKVPLSGFEEEQKSIQQQIEDLAWGLPNLSSTSTPLGSTPHTVGYINEPPPPAEGVGISHVDIGTELQLLDFTAAATTSGWGWYYLINEGAMLEYALIQYALSVARKRGWMAVSPPSIVYTHMAAACGFQPRDQGEEQQIYTLEQLEKDKGRPSLALAGTAEIPLAAMKASQSIPDADLPLKVIGVNRCYRAEAGARGVDAKGLYRVHEFTKVEMFAWTLPDNCSGEHFGEPKPQQSQQIFEEMLDMQKEILESLGLHCRILEMPSNDLGASATRKQDIEAYFPSRQQKHEGWGEVSSLSNCTDYQTRRLATQVRIENKGGRLEFPYTLNGTALAVPRVLACLLENHWDAAEKSVRIPEVLRPWMDGAEFIKRR
ncbi:seryl-tRNA synthetase [Pseudovirgaria hyperparasitica]|uniref:serine--tRNA ligase n=1 Tax=Pseudovirgaria hyperparasitica TaxID=470096 RepID=A0A6A6WBG7_9PEZI|nr:seryl-tRNA synthetase [Pseudovirgaria hyperparasitica]KAF2758451.1 seryl-tRNA synthetase [Pseudovirgaria hyperparasitica]